MKKNLVFKLGLFCAALVLIATCFVSSAWAKYTSTVTATDSARVAKYNFVVDTKSTTSTETHSIALFDTTFTHILGTEDKGADSKKLIAPGSHGSFTLSVDWTGTEVSLDIDYEAVVSYTSNIPVKWRLQTTPESEWKSSLTEVLNALDKTWDVNSAADTSEAPVIEWQWVYDGNDHTDTTLGTNGAEISVSISVTATQVDSSEWAKN